MLRGLLAVRRLASSRVGAGDKPGKKQQSYCSNNTEQQRNNKTLSESDTKNSNTNSNGNKDGNQCEY